MLDRFLSCLPSVITGGLISVIVSLGFQVLPDVCCDGVAAVFSIYELLATVSMILLAVSLFGFLHHAARKSGI